MDLWIRSQDKMKLVKVNYIYIMESNNYFTIYGETIDSGPIIGTYKSKERTLKVLDDIQKKLNGFECIADFEFSDKGLEVSNAKYINLNEVKCNIVYEMPKE